MRAQHRLHFGGGRIDDRRIDLRVLDHELADDADAHALERARPPLGDRPGVRLGGHARSRHRGEDVARVVVAVDGIPEGVEHPHGIGDIAAVDPRPIVVDLGADRAAIEGEQRLVRQDQGHRIVIGRPAARLARFLAEAAHHQVRARRDARPRAGADRRGARRVVRVAGVAGPAAALISQRRGKDLGRGDSYRRDCRGRARCTPSCSLWRR